MVKIAEVTAHAMYFWFPLFLYHQQVMELEAILAVVKGDSVGQGGPGGAGGPHGPRRTSGSSKKINFGGDG